MFKTILVPVAGSAQTNVALETAASLGQKFNAHIECLRVHLDPAQMLATAASADMGSGLAAGQMLRTLQEDDERRTKAARAAFDAFRKRHDISLASEPGARGLTAAWCEVTSNEIDGVLSRAHFNDLVILEHPSGGGGFAPIAAGTVLLGSGRPVLIAGPKTLTNFPRTIAVAWKETAEATRAMAAALPLLAMAEKTVVISVNEDGSKEAVTRDSLAKAVEYLRWHGLTVEGRYSVAGLDGGTETMLAEVQKADAETLVMGGYGHSRLREFILGGFTRSVLKGVSLPVFLYH